jgi:hypothetical protein
LLRRASIGAPSSSDRGNQWGGLQSSRSQKGGGH